MRSYGTHTFHMDAEYFKLDAQPIPADQVFEVARLIDVRGTKVFACWFKCTQPCKVSFDYIWEDTRTVLETTEYVDVVPGESFQRFQFGTYQAGKVNFPMPGLFLRLRIDNTGSPENTITFYGAGQLQ